MVMRRSGRESIHRLLKLTDHVLPQTPLGTAHNGRRKNKNREKQKFKESAGFSYGEFVLSRLCWDKNPKCTTLKTKYKLKMFINKVTTENHSYRGNNKNTKVAK